MKIFKENKAVLCEKPIWICFHSYYMYTGNTLIKLIWQIITEWNNDKHSIG